jgi:hypothetical protein
MAYMEIIIGDGDACKDIYRTRHREKLNAHKKQKNLQSIWRNFVRWYMTKSGDGNTIECI